MIREKSILPVKVLFQILKMAVKHQDQESPIGAINN
jgi:hypothetical protein